MFSHDLAQLIVLFLFSLGNTHAVLVRGNRAYTVTRDHTPNNEKEKARILKEGLLRFLIFEPPHDKTNKMACASSEDSDQPGHPPSLIRVFGVCTKKAWVLSYLLSAQRRL